MAALALYRQLPPARTSRSTASLFSQILIAAALIAVAIVLFMGLANMMKGGSANRSQQLMRWRVILQFAAIVVIMATIFFTSR